MLVMQPYQTIFQQQPAGRFCIRVYDWMEPCSYSQFFFKIYLNKQLWLGNLNFRKALIIQLFAGSNFRGCTKISLLVSESLHHTWRPEAFKCDPVSCVWDHINVQFKYDPNEDYFVLYWTQAVLLLPSWSSSDSLANVWLTCSPPTEHWCDSSASFSQMCSQYSVDWSLGGWDRIRHLRSDWSQDWGCARSIPTEPYWIIQGFSEYRLTNPMFLSWLILGWLRGKSLYLCSITCSMMFTCFFVTGWGLPTPHILVKYFQGNVILDYSCSTLSIPDLYPAASASLCVRIHSQTLLSTRVYHTVTLYFAAGVPKLL